MAAAFLYYAVASFNLVWMRFPDTGAVPIWLPAGLMLFGLVVSRRAIWPGILVGGYLSFLTLPEYAQFSFWQMHFAAAFLSLSSLVGICIAASLIKHYISIPIREQFTYAGFRFVYLAFLGCAVSGVLSLPIFLFDDSIVSFSTILNSTWLRWSLSMFCGMLMVAPLLYVFILSYRNSIFRLRDCQEIVEIVITFTVLAMLNHAIFIENYAVK
ncbi:MAG: MASE1 domain-containing protein [Pseudomonadota bacterium]